MLSKQNRNENDPALPYAVLRQLGKPPLHSDSLHLCLTESKPNYVSSIRLQIICNAGVPVYLTPWTAYPPGGKLTAVGLPPPGG